MQLARASAQTVEPFYSIAPPYHRSSKLVSASREGSILLHWTSCDGDQNALAADPVLSALEPQRRDTLIRTPLFTGPQSTGQDK